MTTLQNKKLGRWWFGAIALGAALAAPFTHAASISEPATTIYGKILRTDAARPYLVTEGTLNWTIRRADGVEVNLQSTLFPLNGGEFSYRLSVPHDALVSGLVSIAGSVPLRLVEEPALHTRITVSGKPAAIIGELGNLFSVAQVRRAATYRLDLMVSLDALDSDGDGLPDWWEKLHGKNNPLEDSDGDGWNNLAEYRNGSNPNLDNRLPTLDTKEVQAYAEASSSIRLRAIDSDSTAANLSYTLETLPEFGTLYLRNVFTLGPAVPGVTGNPDRPLTIGAVITQVDVDQGRLVYVHTALTETAAATRFEVSLRDENPAHAVSRGTVTLFVYRPSITLSPAQLAQVLPGLPGQLPVLAGLPAEEQALTAHYLMGREQNYLITDARRELVGASVSAPSSGLSAADYARHYVPNYGSDRRHLVVGSSGSDRLVGGMEADVLIANGGRDALRGNGGGDVFLFNLVSGGGAIIEDFSVADRDVIDVSRLLTGSSTFLSDYVRVTTDGVDSFLGLSANGTRGSYTDFVVTARGTALAQADLYALVEGGSLRTGNKGLTPLVTISASVPFASENGPQAGSFLIRRGGDTSAEVLVHVLLTGSAQNGSDYRLISTPVRIPAGQNTATLTVTPIVDGVTESTETVEAILQAGAGYVLGSADRAVVTIEDLAVQVRLEAIEPVAIVSGRRGGAFLISRSGIMDRSVLVRLDVKGTAANFTDYDGIPSFINLTAFQTSVVIEVLPKSTAVLTDGAEFVQLGLRPDPAYHVLTPAEARVVIVAEQMTLTEWRQRNFPTATGALADFGRVDTGGHGILNLQRYAFGLDPANPKSSKGIPTFRVREGKLTVDFRRPAWVSGVQYVVEVSDDLVRWESSPAHVEPMALSAIGQAGLPAGSTEADLVSFVAKRAATDVRPHFMRVRVVLTP